MRTVAISINKGGVGKTTLAKLLASAATAAGLNVLVLDMDTQQNAIKLEATAGEAGSAARR